MGALPGHSRGHQIHVWLGEGNESGLGKISVTSLVIWFEGKSGGTQEPSNCNQAGDIIWSHRVCSNFILHSPIPSQLRGVCVCVCVCVCEMAHLLQTSWLLTCSEVCVCVCERWLIYCKPHGYLPARRCVCVCVRDGSSIANLMAAYLEWVWDWETVIYSDRIHQLSENLKLQIKSVTP